MYAESFKNGVERSAEKLPVSTHEALAFIEACRAEKQWTEEKFLSRRTAVLAGGWVPTFEELEHGARMAWRNNARCIGRLFWPSLRVRDLRHVSDPDEVYMALLEHLAIGTNNGKIQPMATIFAPIVIQKRGEAPRVYPPPTAQAMEVPITHPQFSWFADMGLKWYVIPVLSDMNLRMGGIDFAAAPFNGWYMGT